jgi:hypothetical protein
MSSSKKCSCKGTSRQVFICLRPPPFLGFCLGWSSNFVGSESGQIHSVKLPQNMVSNKTQHPPPRPTDYKDDKLRFGYYVFMVGGGGGIWHPKPPHGPVSPLYGPCQAFYWLCTIPRVILIWPYGEPEG